MGSSINRWLVAFFVSIATISSFAETPTGSETVTDLYSPFFAGSGAFITATGDSQANAVNPAASGMAQRTTLDAGYLVLPGLGDESGLGHAINLGAVYPTKYAVFGGSAHFLTSPFDAFPVGTTFSVDLNAAKELYPGFSVGAGLSTGFGTDWTLALDLGLRHELGDFGVLKDFTWAFTLGGLGKSWTPSAFTPIAGVAFNLVRVPAESKDAKDPFLLGVSADLGAPGFTNLTGKLGLDATIAGILKITTSTGFNLSEALDGDAISPIPSVGLTLNLALSGKKDIMQGKLPSDGEVATTIAAKPLYNGVWAFGAGASWTLGVVDKIPPAITVDYLDTRWISPNNDGKADTLEFPIAITDQRYVAEWVLEIRDESGAVVRTLRNKERRAETQGVRGIIDRLADVKSGVEVPAALRWDGVLDSGAVAPDGHYFFVLSAKDDNGNAASSPRYEVVVDNTPPEVAVKIPADPLRILSPDGDGSKDTFQIDQSGSPEDLWTAEIVDAAGTKVRTLNVTDGAPDSFVWDGRDDSGRVVPDGVYKYAIAATDRALNSGSGGLENIIVNTERPPVNLLIEEAYFSPNGDGLKDTLALSPGVPVKEGIVNWTIKIQNNSNATRRIISGGAGAPTRLAFDGMDDLGKRLDEGTYYAELSVVYQNGNNSVAVSPPFVVDLTPPAASTRADFPAFSPNADGKLDEMMITQGGSDETAWTGELRRSVPDSGTGLLIKTFRFSGVPPTSLKWDGRDDAGRLAADGDYEYRLLATDRAGNSGASQVTKFSLSTADTPVLLTADSVAFSPNGDGVKDSLTLVPQLKIAEGVATWKVDILDDAGTAVRTFEGKGSVPKTIVWNGKDSGGATVKDGSYTAHGVIRYTMGNEPTANSAAFIVDTVAPALDLSVPYTLFSPNGDGRKDDLPITIRTPGSDEWEASVVGAKGAIVTTWRWKGSAPTLAWDGKDSAGNAAGDGSYRFVAKSTDEAGNKTERSLNDIVVDARTSRAFLTASVSGLSPNGDGVSDDLRFGLVVTLRDGIESWKIEILDESGAVHRVLTSSDAASASNPPSSLVWDGRDDGGAVSEGKRTATLSVAYRKGDFVTATAGPFIVDVSAPALKFDSTPRWFSPDNDGVEDELYMSLAAPDASAIASWNLEIREPQPPYQVFYKLEGKGTPADRIVWDGRSNKGELVQAATDYDVKFQATDVLGNSGSVEGTIGVDVLVIREGDVLKIKVPSIIFRENANDFNGLSQEIVDNNIRVLKRIAQILNKFRDYKVKVEGHANPVLRTAAEEKNELQPLSEARAQAVVAKLVEFGVDGGRLSAVGMGGTRPVVKWEDHDNWWKNRRVEFILVK